MPPSKSARPGIQVFKFGGASLADGAAFRHAAAIVKSSDGPVAVVCSAPKGVTDLLLEVANQARIGAWPQVEGAMGRLRSTYGAILRSCGAHGRARADAAAELDLRLAELEALARGLLALGELTPRTSDLIVARGERMGARLFEVTLAGAGIKSRFVDALMVVRTLGPFGGANPDLEATADLVKKHLRPLLARGIVPVVPGFIGGYAPDDDGHGGAGGGGSGILATATLGRGGSDLTATLLARGLSAKSVSLWKDVPGLMTSDPRVVPDARVVPQLNVREAAELAYYGAKVLHPRALIPVAGRNIPVLVRPFGDPRSIGTEISNSHTLDRYPVKALSAAPGQALVTVAGRGLIGVPGVAGRVFSALSRQGLSVALISQSSSEQTICFTLPEGQARAARSCLAREFAAEMARRDIDEIQILPGVATIAVVGLGMAGHVGIAARVFTALAAGNVNLIAIAQGSSELNISFVVRGSEAAEAQRRIHDAFQLAKIGGGGTAGHEAVDVVLLGFGQIGRTLAGLIARGVRGRRTKVRVVAVLERSGFVFVPEGLSTIKVARLAAHKAAGHGLASAPGGRRATPAEAIASLAKHALLRPVLVDVTADDTHGLLLAAATAGMDLVLANKRPLSAPRAEHDLLRKTVHDRGRRLRFEATVGAGLPILDTYRKLAESGDRVLKIEGCVSGTLGFVLGELSRGRDFSAAMGEAIARGYTEPDPRDDLSGADVGRKALILGRLLGFPGGPHDVVVESLVPEAARKLSREAFLARLPEWDEAWRKRVESARAKDLVLRYIATVTGKKIKVGLQRVSRRTPFAALDGTDNQIAFTTTRYRSPLVITGAGAGLEVTAAGVLNDILDLGD